MTSNVLDSIWLALRSLLWTMLLPGVVAGYLPWQYLGVKDVRLDFANPIHVGAVVVIGLGCGLLAWCIWEFAHSGKGTLAPIDAPTRLVVQGLYRHVRNPMYLSVSTNRVGGSAADAIAGAVPLLGRLFHGCQSVRHWLRRTCAAPTLWCRL